MQNGGFDKGNAKETEFKFSKGSHQGKKWTEIKPA
jgi:hypothetical protein